MLNARLKNASFVAVRTVAGVGTAARLSMACGYGVSKEPKLTLAGNRQHGMRHGD
jgi:hypothetical protein